MRDEIQNIDRKTKKLLNIYQVFPSQGDVDRLYFECNSGGRRLVSMEFSVDIEIENLWEYV